MSSKGLEKVNDSTFQSPKGIRQCELKLVTHSAQSTSVAEWKKEVNRQARKTSAEKALQASRNWWTDFWKQSYIYVDIPEDPDFAYRLTQSYILQRYMLAGSGRGNFPVKFNGSIFTTDPKFTRASADYSPDYRNWGNDFWWQNTRLPYYAMLANGDFDQMQALFDFYLSRMSAFRTLAAKYYQAKGAFIPETVTVFGTYANGDYGWEREGHSPNEVLNIYIRHIWVQGLELSKLMLDYASYSGDEAFCGKRHCRLSKSLYSILIHVSGTDRERSISHRPSQWKHTGMGWRMTCRQWLVCTMYWEHWRNCRLIFCRNRTVSIICS